MGKITAISWCDHTFSPWLGCTKVSPACDGCYAEHLMDTRMGRVSWGGPGKGTGTRARTSPANWKQPLKWNKDAAKAGTRPFVFCASLADVFDNKVPHEWRVDLFELIYETPHLVWLLLTKRPQNILPLAGGLPRYGWPRNAAIGTTVEDQERANLNIPELLHAKRIINPAFAFLSMEPLIGNVFLDSNWLAKPGGIDWIITGGETNQGTHFARPTNPKWLRYIRDRAKWAVIPYHHKQNGEWMPTADLPDAPGCFTFGDGRTVRRVGKKNSGRTIDGVEHNARPEVS